MFFLSFFHQIYCVVFIRLIKETVCAGGPLADNNERVWKWTRRYLCLRRRVNKANHIKQTHSSSTESHGAHWKLSGRAGWGNACSKMTQAGTELKCSESQRASPSQGETLLTLIYPWKNLTSQTYLFSLPAS